MRNWGKLVYNHIIAALWKKKTLVNSGFCPWLG